MTESKRQRQVAALLQEEFNIVFRKLGLTMLDGGMISISKIMVTPDLLEARVYLSMFKVDNEKTVMDTIEKRSWEIKKELSGKVGKHLRRMPVIHYYNDDTLEYVFKMEEVFEQIRKEDEERAGGKK